MCILATKGRGGGGGGGLGGQPPPKPAGLLGKGPPTNPPMAKALPACAGDWAP